MTLPTYRPRRVKHDEFHKGLAQSVMTLPITHMPQWGQIWWIVQIFLEAYLLTPTAKFRYMWLMWSHCHCVSSARHRLYWITGWVENEKLTFYSRMVWIVTLSELGDSPVSVHCVKDVWWHMSEILTTAKFVRFLTFPTLRWARYGFHIDLK